jgi:hypothetical protein
LLWVFGILHICGPKPMNQYRFTGYRDSGIHFPVKLLGEQDFRPFHRDCSDGENAIRTLVQGSEFRVDDHIALGTDRGVRRKPAVPA